MDLDRRTRQIINFVVCVIGLILVIVFYKQIFSSLINIGILVLIAVFLISLIRKAFRI